MVAIAAEPQVPLFRFIAFRGLLTLVAIMCYWLSKVLMHGSGSGVQVGPETDRPTSAAELSSPLAFRSANPPRQISFGLQLAF
jgi:hypothetical protein